MNTKFRSTTAAAAMLLASLGAIMVAQPAAAQHRGAHAQPAVVVAPPVIERFVLRHADSLEPGEQIRFRLVGAAGGRAWLEVPGVLRAAAMTEIRPGIYVADYVIRRHDNPRAFERAVATLQKGGQRVAAQVDFRDGREPRHARDDRPPQISDLTPSNGDRVGARGWTRISARFSDAGSGVDPASVVLRIDGQDVTARARVNGDDIRYAEDLPRGRHVAELLVRDRAGNATRSAWSFNVVGRDRDYSAYDDDREYQGNRRW